VPYSYNLTETIIKLLEKDPGQQIQQLAKALKVNRTFLAGYFSALESKEKVKSEKIGPAKVYLKGDNVKGGWK